MSNSENLASQTASTASQDVKPLKSSYWLTKEEKEDLRRDLKETLAWAREHDK